MTVCAQCGQWRERADLLMVTDVRTGKARFICRPTAAATVPGYREATCFVANVRGRDLDRIETA